MDKRSIAAVLVWAGMWFVLAPAAPGQIASYVDEHGKLIFINSEAPAHRRDKPKPAQATSPGGEVSNASAPALLPDRLERIVSESAERNRLDPALVKAVIGVESGGDPGAISRKGARGLMQLIPSTAERYGVSNAFDPAQNVEGGARYLRALLDRYNGDLNKSLAAYNAGENAVERYGGVPNYRETRAYVERVTDTYFQPGSARFPAIWRAPRHPIRKTVDDQGRVIFTNE